MDTTRTAAAREYLEQACRLEEQLNSKLAQLEELNSLATKTTSTLSGLPHDSNRTHSRLEDVIVKIVGMQEEINADIDRMVDLRIEIQAKIAALGNPDHRVILERRYLCGDRWEEIAQEMNLTTRYILQLHREALAEMEKLVAGKAA